MLANLSGVAGLQRDGTIVRHIDRSRDQDAISRESVGSLIRFKPLPLSSLPTHPLLYTAQATPRYEAVPGASQDDYTAPPPQGGADLELFLLTILDEAHNFMTKYVPKRFVIKGADKISKGSRAGVLMTELYMPTVDLPGPCRMGTSIAGISEHWVGRRSIHDNEMGEGTLSWEEVEQLVDMEYWQTKVRWSEGEWKEAKRVLDWDVGLRALGWRVGAWEDIRMSGMLFLL